MSEIGAGESSQQSTKFKDMPKFILKPSGTIFWESCSLIQQSQQTLLSLLVQNLTFRQAPSAHLSRCLLILGSQGTPLTLLAHNQTHRQVSSAHLHALHAHTAL